MKPYLLMALTLLLPIGLAYWLNNLNFTRIETGPTETFALVNPLPAADLTGNVTVQIRVGNFKPDARIGCKTEKPAPVLIINLDPEAGT